MADDLVPALHDPSFGGSQLQAWEDHRPPMPAIARSPLERPVAAMRRFKWLLLLIVAVSAGGGVAATRFLTAQYEVVSRFMIESDNPMDAKAGPIRTMGLLSSDDWSQLLRSGRIADAVARQLNLYVQPDNSTDTELFEHFSADQFRAGKYQLAIDRTRGRWTLTRMSAGVVTDSGTAADTVGRNAGFRWAVPRWVFSGSGVRT